VKPPVLRAHDGDAIARRMTRIAYVARRPTSPVLGLRENWRQFSLLVVVSAFVGAMVGLERTVFPLLATGEFGIASTSAVLSFIATFGLTKAITNLFAGWLVGRQGRRRTLITGWLVGLPVPFVILFAPSWSWIVGANALLGVSQGLTWSTTVIMKIDLVGPARRGFAMGLNEFAGYVAVAAAAFASALVAERTGMRAGPAYLGISIAITGLLLSVFLVRDTTGHAQLEERSLPRTSVDGPGSILDLLRQSLWPDPRLFSLSQAGLVNNLNDGLAWGLFPLLFAAAGLPLGEVGWLVALYPATWGICQIGTGALSDRLDRKRLIVAGMIIQGGALLAIAAARTPRTWAVALTMLGIGTALVYPTLLVAVSDGVRPVARAAALGVYRMWRDLGYVAGALTAGVLADFLNVNAAIAAVGVLTLASGLGVAVRLPGRPTTEVGGPSANVGRVPS
jgi:MFS family permease